SHRGLAAPRRRAPDRRGARARCAALRPATRRAEPTLAAGSVGRSRLVPARAHPASLRGAGAAQPGRLGRALLRRPHPRRRGAGLRRPAEPGTGGRRAVAPPIRGAPRRLPVVLLPDLRAAADTLPPGAPGSVPPRGVRRDARFLRALPLLHLLPGPR